MATGRRPLAARYAISMRPGSKPWRRHLDNVGRVSARHNARRGTDGRMNPPYNPITSRYFTPTESGRSSGSRLG